MIFITIMYFTGWHASVAKATLILTRSLRWIVDVICTYSPSNFPMHTNKVAAQGISCMKIIGGHVSPPHPPFSCLLPLPAMSPSTALYLLLPPNVNAAKDQKQRCLADCSKSDWEFDDERVALNSGQWKRDFISLASLVSYKSWPLISTSLY